jgi:hypothetical protein
MKLCKHINIPVNPINPKVINFWGNKNVNNVNNILNDIKRRKTSPVFINNENGKTTFGNDRAQ